MAASPLMDLGARSLPRSNPAPGHASKLCLSQPLWRSTLETARRLELPLELPYTADSPVACLDPKNAALARRLTRASAPSSEAWPQETRRQERQVCTELAPKLPNWTEGEKQKAPLSLPKPC